MPFNPRSLFISLKIVGRHNFHFSFTVSVSRSFLPSGFLVHLDLSLSLSLRFLFISSSCLHFSFSLYFMLSFVATVMATLHSLRQTSLPSSRVSSVQVSDHAVVTEVGTLDKSAP